MQSYGSLNLLSGMLCSKAIAMQEKITATALWQVSVNSSVPLITDQRSGLWESDLSSVALHDLRAPMRHEPIVCDHCQCLFVPYLSGRLGTW